MTEKETCLWLLGYIIAKGYFTKNALHITVPDDTANIRDQLGDALSKYGLYSQEPGEFVTRGKFADEAREAIFANGSTFNMPAGLDKEGLTFLTRGVFDGIGDIALAPRATIPVNERIADILKEINTSFDIPSVFSEKGAFLVWEGPNAIDFLSRLYETAYYCDRVKRGIYYAVCTFCPPFKRDERLTGPLYFKYKLVTDKAVKPSKKNASDSGYDIVLTERLPDIGNVQFYDTGVVVIPSPGFYFDLVPRSSIIKSGYMLANNVGVIDQSYRGTIKVPLVKIDPSKPDLELPSRLVQIILRPVLHGVWIENRNEVTDITASTTRAEGGFGSTNEQ